MKNAPRASARSRAPSVPTSKPSARNEDEARKFDEEMKREGLRTTPSARPRKSAQKKVDTDVVARRSTRNRRSAPKKRRCVSTRKRTSAVRLPNSPAPRRFPRSSRRRSPRRRPTTKNAPRRPGAFRPGQGPGRPRRLPSAQQGRLPRAGRDLKERRQGKISVTQGARQRKRRSRVRSLAAMNACAREGTCAHVPAGPGCQGRARRRDPPKRSRCRNSPTACAERGVGRHQVADEDGRYGDHQPADRCRHGRTDRR